MSVSSATVCVTNAQFSGRPRFNRQSLWLFCGQIQSTENAEEKLRTLCSQIGATRLRSILEREFGVVEYAKLTSKTIQAIPHYRFAKIQWISSQILKQETKEWDPSDYPSSIGQIPITSPFHPKRIWQKKAEDLEGLITQRSEARMKLQEKQECDACLADAALKKIAKEKTLTEAASVDEEYETDASQYAKKNRASYRLLADLWIREGSLEQEIQLLTNKISESDAEFACFGQTFVQKEKEYFDFEMDWHNALSIQSEPVDFPEKRLNRNIGSLSINCECGEEPSDEAELRFLGSSTPTTTEWQQPPTPQKTGRKPRQRLDTPFAGSDE